MPCRSRPQLGCLRFEPVATGTNGEFIDSVEHRPPSKITYVHSSHGDADEKPTC